jgi:hypothetical protein
VKLGRQSRAPTEILQHSCHEISIFFPAYVKSQVIALDFRSDSCVNKELVQEDSERGKIRGEFYISMREKSAIIILNYHITDKYTGILNASLNTSLNASYIYIIIQCDSSHGFYSAPLRGHHIQ